MMTIAIHKQSRFAFCVLCILFVYLIYKNVLRIKMVQHENSSSSSGSTHPTFERTKRMPLNEQEIIDAFEEVLAKMDLPPDKMRVLRDCTIKKKWDLVCDQRQFSIDHSVTEPDIYLAKLKVFMDKKAMKKKKKFPTGESPTEVLKHIEISLRTNSIDWVRSFLSPQNDGLRVIVGYLSQLQESFFSILVSTDHRCEPSTSAGSTAELACLHGQTSLEYASPEDSIHLQTSHAGNFSASGSSASFTTYIRDDVPEKQRRGMSIKNNGKSAAKYAKKLEDMEDEQHICISCLRSLLNNKFGIAAVFENKQAIYCIVRGILHPNLRTKTLALDLLSGIVSLEDGHELVLNSFNRFRADYNEAFRFQTLICCFRSPSEISIDFLSSSVKFINVLVHSTCDMNQRVALQYEFAQLGLEKYLEQLSREYESEFLLKHINSYWDNSIDVEALNEKSLKCEELDEECLRLQEACSRQKEEYQVLQANCFVQIAQLNAQKAKLAEEKLELERQKTSKEVKINTLTKDWRERETKFESERSEYEKRIAALEQAKREIQQGLKIAQSSAVASAPPPPQQIKVANNTAKLAEKVPEVQPKTAAAPAPPPPPPPPVELLANNRPKVGGPAVPPPPPPPPPAPALMSNIRLKASDSKTSNSQLSVNVEVQPKKKVAETKSKLPMLNLAALNPNQVKGTVFCQLNDERLADVLDLSRLEEMFKIGADKTDDKSERNSQMEDSAARTPLLGQPSPNSTLLGGGAGKVSLLGTKRLQNIAIIRRKIGKSAMEIMTAVHRFDFTVLGPDQVEVLLPIVPTSEEVAKLSEYGAQHNGNFDNLTAEDQFLVKLMDIERLAQKLTLMKFMGDFAESVKLLIPQIQKITAASKSIQSAKKFPKIIEVILAVGNAMNGTRRAPIYGFRLNSLDTLTILKSSKDRSLTLMHILAEMVADTFPDLVDFATELKLAESAATVNFETISADVRDIEAKYAQTLSEQQRKGKMDSPTALNEFLESATPQIATLRENFKLAQQAFAECAEYFGESTSNILQPEVFFTRIASFCKHFEQALADYESKKSAEKKQQEAQRRRSSQLRRHLLGANRESTAAGQERMIDELNSKFMQLTNGNGAGPGNTRSQMLKSSKLDDGDFEKIMNGLKDGFVAVGNAPIAVRRRKSPSPNRQQLNSSRERVS